MKTISLHSKIDKRISCGKFHHLAFSYNPNYLKADIVSIYMDGALLFKYKQLPLWKRIMNWMNTERFIILNKWQMKNKELVKAFKQSGYKVMKDKKVPTK